GRVRARPPRRDRGLARRGRQAPTIPPDHPGRADGGPADPGRRDRRGRSSGRMSRPPADASAAPGSGSQISGQMWLLAGVIPVIGYALTTGILNVYAGRMFQSHDPGSVAAISFSLTA